MSERNLPEVICTARVGHQRNVNDACWNAALEDTVEFLAVIDTKHNQQFHKLQS